MTLPEASGSGDPTLSWVEYTKLVVETPGVDPLEAEATSDPESIPGHGYLITATVQPGLRIGTVDVEKYDAIGFEEVESSDEFGTRHGTRRIHGTARTATIRCGHAADVLYVGDDEDDPIRSPGFTPTGGRITELSDRTVVAERLHAERVEPRDLTAYDPTSDQYLGEHQAIGVSIVRAVRTVEEASAVLASVGRGMGLRHGDFQGFMNAGVGRLASMVYPDSVEYYRLRELVGTTNEAQWLQRLGAVIKSEVEIAD